MDNFEYCAPTYYVFGRDTQQQAGQLASQYLGKKILLVYGQGSVIRSGLLDQVKQSLDKAHVTYVELSGIQPNPTDGPVREAIKLIRENDLAGVLAVGGGSVIDTAKAAALGALYNGDFWDFYCGKTPVEKALPVGTILTIPAAGSEGSGNSVITLTPDMKKISLKGGHVLRPKFSILNPELTYTLPAYQTASGVTDMIAHILERYFTATSDVSVTDRIAEGLIKSIIETAPRVFANPADYQARANIMWAGTMAHNDSCGVGRTQEWVSHGLEHEISALYGVTHGAGLAVIFPAYMTYMANHRPERVAQLARRVFDVDTENDKEAALCGIDKFKRFLASIDMPLSFKQLGVTNPDIDLMVKNLHANKGQIIGFYHPLDSKATKEIYQLAL